MAVKKTKVVYQVKRDTNENWTKTGKVLKSGEFGLDTTNQELAIGNGEDSFSDRPKFKTKYDFATCSWKKIAELAASGKAEENFAVGDKKVVKIDGTDYTFVILGFNHDDLSDGSGKAPITIGMENLYSDYSVMNETRTNAGGWDECYMRKTTMANILALLPEDLQAVIKTVDKKASAGSTSSTITTSQDKLFLFSEVEIDGTTSSVYVNEGEQYEYYKTIKDGSTAAGRIKYLPSGSSHSWWLRSPYARSLSIFCSVSSIGGMSSYYASNSSFGVCFGFCI